MPSRSSHKEEDLRSLLACAVGCREVETVSWGPMVGAKDTLSPAPADKISEHRREKYSNLRCLEQ